MNRSLTLSICLFLAGCGNDSSPTAASATPTPAATTSTTTTTLTFNSTVTGNPVAGADVVVAGTAYTTGADGTITLSAPAAAAATMDVSAAGYLDRVTVVGSATTVTVWQIPTGADANFVRQLAYNRGGTPEVLWRPSAAAIYLQLTGELASDPQVRAAHVQAAAMASALTEGRVRVELGNSVAGAGLFTVLLNSSNPGTATTYLTQSGGTIQGGRMEYTTSAAARTVRVIAHELGHVLGFGHAPSGLMCPSACGVDAFGPWERDVFVSMWQRPPGTAPPDNDRVVVARSQASTGVFNCDIR